MSLLRLLAGASFALFQPSNSGILSRATASLRPLQCQPDLMMRVGRKRGGCHQTQVVSLSIKLEYVRKVCCLPQDLSGGKVRNGSDYSMFLSARL
ncbi:hypothetical protein NPIL_645951 [Nephila pilipes]|uniref:Uncharacterized protein n=1 Tax=Nephila pilipes TaxID=299642 RepID=A0A8X6TW09_NEPPI|nr:hypothetical protein NPIL_645951 [Nephila pilipes]